MKYKYINNISKNIKLNPIKKSLNYLNGKYKKLVNKKDVIIDTLKDYDTYDDARNINWKVSAKYQKLLVNKYISKSNHNISIILDSSYLMNAHTDKNEIKRIVAIYTAATIGTIALNNNDKLNIIVNKESIFINNLNELDINLQKYEEIISKTNTINNSLSYILDNNKKKSCIFIITDIKSIDNLNIKTISKLSKNNDILIININDHNLSNYNIIDINTKKYIPKIFINNKRLIKEEYIIRNRIIRNQKKQLSKYIIPIISISSKSEINIKLIRLLEEFKYVKQ